jgi:hypothetical protein
VSAAREEHAFPGWETITCFQQVDEETSSVFLDSVTCDCIIESLDLEFEEPVRLDRIETSARQLLARSQFRGTVLTKASVGEGVSLRCGTQIQVILLGVSRVRGTITLRVRRPRTLVWRLGTMEDV